MTAASRLTDRQAGLGFAPQELVGLSFYELVHPRDVSRVVYAHKGDNRTHPSLPA